MGAGGGVGADGDGVGAGGGVGANGSGVSADGGGLGAVEVWVPVELWVLVEAVWVPLEMVWVPLEVCVPMEMVWVPTEVCQECSQVLVAPQLWQPQHHSPRHQLDGGNKWSLGQFVRAGYTRVSHGRL